MAYKSIFLAFSVSVILCFGNASEPSENSLKLSSEKSSQSTVNVEPPSPSSPSAEGLIELHIDNLTYISFGKLFPSSGARVYHLLKNGVGGWQNFSRSFHYYRHVFLSGSLGGERPETKEDAESFADNLWKYIKKSGTLQFSDSETGIIISTHEFALNGSVNERQGGEGAEKWSYSASLPITPEIYKVFEEQMKKNLKKANRENVVFIVGGIAIDTGKEIEVDEIKEGEFQKRLKKIGENRGLVMFSKDEEVVEFTKRLRSEVDGWTDAYSVPTVNEKSKGMEVVPLDKIFPGRQDVMALCICKDVSEAKFPMDASLIFVGSAGGAPPDVDSVQNKSASLIMSDAALREFNNRLSGQEIEFTSYDATGIYDLKAPKPETPLFKNAMEAIKMFFLGRDFVVPSAEKAVEKINTWEKEKKSFPLFYKNGYMLVSGLRELPLNLSKHEVNVFKEEIEKDSTTILDPRFDKEKESEGESSLDEYLKSQVELTAEERERRDPEDFRGHEERGKKY